MTAVSTPLTTRAPARASGEAAVEHVARTAGVSTAAARTFAKISAPDNKPLFSAQAALKAFSHVKVSS
jgi:hypothetical protein